MDQHLFLEEQGVTTPEDEGEVFDAVGDNVTVKLDNGEMRIFPSGGMTDQTSAG